MRERAVERVRGRASTLAQYKSASRRVVLGITGCVAEHLREELRGPTSCVDLVVGPDSYRRLPEHIERARAGERVQDTHLNPHETYQGLGPGLGPVSAPANGVVGHMAIRPGCDRFCTFCVVPFAVGRERASSPEEILRQVRALAEAGYREVQLVGQTVNSYHFREGEQEVSFAALLREVAAINGIARIRFMSPYPLDFSPAVIAAMAELPKVCRHVHLPLQSASDAVLEHMRRGYGFAEYRVLVAALRAAMPEIAITTDLLVGFCGESEADFQATCQAQADIRFDNAFTFPYSERKGTLAARKLKDDIPAQR